MKKHYQTLTEMMIDQMPPPREIPTWVRVVATPIVKVLIWWKLRKQRKRLRDYIKMRV